MVSLNKKQIEAAQEFSQVTIALLKMEQGVHAETAIAGAARMAGALLLRSFGLDLENFEPGQLVLSDDAKGQGPVLVQILASMLSHAGVELNQNEIGQPADSEHQPLLDFLATQQQLEPGYIDAKNRFKLTFEQASHSAAAATALLIQQCVQVLKPEIGFGLAVYGFTEGVKTLPCSISS